MMMDCIQQIKGDSMKNVLITSNVRHCEDNKNIFSLSLQRSLTDREASELLADMIVNHLHTTVSNRTDTIYTYSVEVVGREFIPLEDKAELKVIHSIIQKVKLSIIYYISKILTKGWYI